MSISWKLKNHLINTLGWRTTRKIVVFESDDWGMIRTSSKKSFDDLKKKGYPVESSIYTKFDALESNIDVMSLGEVLMSVKDKHDNHAKFTLNNVVANPNFKRILENNFIDYSYEPFTDTLKKYKDSDKVLDFYFEGINKGVFKVQFHGREHINVNRWMHALQNHNKRFLDAFDCEMLTVSEEENASGRKDFLDAFGMGYEVELETMSSIITSGLQLFENIWGEKSKSFIAPCYTWTPAIEPILADLGIRFIQGTHVQRNPIQNMKISKVYHYQGQKNGSNQTYLVRNVIFEPVESNMSINSIDSALYQIRTAFLHNKPAVISSHRVNYIGRICKKNQSSGLILLKSLLEKIIAEFPDVEFMSSDELGELMD